MLPLQTPQEMDVDELLNAVLDLKPIPDMRPRNLFPEEVCFTPFPPGYRFPTFVIYRGHTDPLKYHRRFVRQCGATAENDALLLKRFPLSLGRIAYDWYRTLHGMIISTWEAMEKLFLKEQSTYRHNPEFLRNITENAIGRIEEVLWILSQTTKTMSAWVKPRMTTEMSRCSRPMSSGLKGRLEIQSPGINSLARSKPDLSKNLPSCSRILPNKRSGSASNPNRHRNQNQNKPKRGIMCWHT